MRNAVQVATYTEKTVHCLEEIDGMTKQLDVEESKGRLIRDEPMYRRSMVDSNVHDWHAGIASVSSGGPRVSTVEQFVLCCTVRTTGLKRKEQLTRPCFNADPPTPFRQ